MNMTTGLSLFLESQTLYIFLRGTIHWSLFGLLRHTVSASAAGFRLELNGSFFLFGMSFLWWVAWAQAYQLFALWRLKWERNTLVSDVSCKQKRRQDTACRFGTTRSISLGPFLNWTKEFENHIALTLCILVTPLMRTFTNSEDPDEMPQIYGISPGFTLYAKTRTTFSERKAT